MKTLVFALLLCGVVIAHAFTDERQNEAQKREGIYKRRLVTIQPDRRGTWGTWGRVDMCPEEHFANAFSLKVEGHQHGRDDTALNAIKLYCSEDGRSLTSTEGPWGHWQGKRTCFGNDQYLNGFRMRNERKQGGGDDTAANDIQMHCSPSGHILYGGGMKWGRWSSWTYCPSGSAVCGLQTRVERKQGGGDDTALNNVRFFCCRLPQ